MQITKDGVTMNLPSAWENISNPTLGQMIERGWSVAPEPEQPTAEEIIAELTQAVQDHLDTTARTRNYDGILSACTYVSDPNPVFSAEGQACIVWRGACWAKSYEVMKAVQLGQRAVPSSAVLIAELPVLVW